MYQCGLSFYILFIKKNPPPSPYNIPCFCEECPKSPFQTIICLNWKAISATILLTGGSKMRRRIKILVISTAVVAAALSVLLLIKHFSPGLIPAVVKSCRLAATLPNFTTLSKHFHDNQYLPYLKDIALVAFLFLLLVWRALLLIRPRED